ncbi:MAG: protein phosphatase 2C domain-containing protein [Gammaproteobacteria bacterium]
MGINGNNKPTASTRQAATGRLYSNAEMQQGGELYAISTGQVGVYVNRSPEKETANEDSAGVFNMDANACALVVADGMGGMPCGDQASRIVVESLQGALSAAKASDFGYRDFMLNGIEQANEKINELGVGAGSTMAAVEINNHVLRPYHVGDSMILVVGQRGKIKLQTISHSPVGYAVESGLLNEQEALHHDDRHVVSNYVGNPEMRIEIGPTLELSRYDTVILATDGLFDNLTLSEIAQMIRKDPLEKVSQRLIDLCGERMRHEDTQFPSKPDDVSFIVFRRNK